MEYLYSQTGKQWNTELVNLDHDEPHDEGFEEILSCYDDSTVTAPCLEMAFPSREQGDRSHKRSPCQCMVSIQINEIIIIQ